MSRSQKHNEIIPMFRSLPLHCCPLPRRCRFVASPLESLRSLWEGESCCTAFVCRSSLPYTVVAFLDISSLRLDYSPSRRVISLFIKEVRVQQDFMNLKSLQHEFCLNQYSKCRCFSTEKIGTAEMLVLPLGSFQYVTIFIKGGRFII